MPQIGRILTEFEFRQTSAKHFQRKIFFAHFSFLLRFVPVDYASIDLSKDLKWISQV